MESEIRPRERQMLPTLIYEEWIKKEGIPLYEGVVGVEDITELPRRPWARLGGSGTFVQIEATKQAGQGLYVVEIPAGGALEPEKHLYDELIYIWRGRGLTEVWQERQSKHSFEWGEGSLFVVPTNAWHRLVNGSREPALLFGKTSAPALMNILRDTEFIFNCDHNFTDRYKGEAEYFIAGEKRYKVGLSPYWETNFVPDVRSVFLDDCVEKAGPDGRLTFFVIASWGGAHASEWPVGRYHKAHHHGPGALLLGLKSEGYVLVWPAEYGIHPYQDGYGDKIMRMNWKPGSIYSPFGASMFHQHFNTGPEPARHMNYGGGGHGFSGLMRGRRIEDSFAISVREGGILIEYEDEDPEIRRMFQEELGQKGVKFAMPPVVYRTDPFAFSLF